MIRVAINGYGTIGKRVADAVSLQDDMKIIGVCKTKPNYLATDAVRRGYPLYCAVPENVELFKKAGIHVAGSVEEMLKKCDVVVDCTPGKKGVLNKPMYERLGMKAIFQGGEKADVAECSFNAQTNYDKAIGKKSVRVVSCNTTGLARTVRSVMDATEIGRITVSLVRRAADPGDSDSGPVNAIVPEVTKVPSHHGPDLKTVIDGLDIFSLAVEVPTTLMHIHLLAIDLKKPTTREQILESFKKNPRIKLVKFADGYASTAQIMEYARSVGRGMADLYEIAVWEESVNIKENTLYFVQAVHQESDVVPDNIDCIRAITGIEKDAKKSMEKTNRTMRIGV